MDISIIIPTFNGAKKIPRLLDCLNNQIGLENTQWEAILVDNNSSDNTREVFESYRSKWKQKSELRYISEQKQGAGKARQRGVEEAKGKYVAFLDDDNYPDPDWVEKAYRFGELHPSAGAWSGRIEGEYEINPPDGFEKVKSFFGRINQEFNTHQFNIKNKILPATAGLVARRDVWLKYIPKVLFLENKGKERGSAGEDIEALLYIQKAQWEIWHNPEMNLKHAIQKERLQEPYLKKLCYSCGLGRYVFRVLRFGKWSIPFVFFIGLVTDLNNLVSFHIKYRARLNKNLAATCRFEYLKGTLVSPFYCIKRYLFNR